MIIDRLNEMINSGAMQRVTGQCYESKTWKDCKDKNSSALEPVSFNKTSFLFVLLAFGAVLSGLVNLLEAFFFEKNTRCFWWKRKTN